MRRRIQTLASSPVLILLVGSSLAACGSTVQLSGTRAGAAAGGDGLGTLTTTAAAPDGQSRSASGASSGSDVAVPEGSRPGTGSVFLGDSSSSSPGENGPLRPQRNTEPIQIGIGITTNAGAVSKQFGYNLDFGNNKAQAQAVVDDINLHGGLDGRKIVPVFHVYDGADTSPTSVKEQAACQDYTVDHDVLAVAGALSATTDTLLPCLNKAGVPFVAGAAAALYDQKTFDQLPYLVAPSMFGGTRMFKVFLDDLLAQGWFGKWGSFPSVKVGVLYHEKYSPHKRLVDDAIKPELKRLGHPLAMEFSYSADQSQQVSDIQNAVLQFKAANISQVFFVAPGGGAPLLFMQAAENQLYRPRYALNTYDSPGGFVQGKAPPAQLTGTLGIGWVPLQDVDGARDDISSKISGYARCDALMRKAGVDMSNRTTAYAAGQYCDTIYFLAKIAVQASRWTGRGLMDQVSVGGSSFLPAMTFASRFPPGVRDGASAYRRLRFDDSCNCFAYVGSMRPAR